MGTNFYLKMKYEYVKELFNTMFKEAYSTKEYKTFFDNTEIHIAKTSAGWLPLFQQTVGPDINIKSVKDIKQYVDSGKYIITDEYDEEYTWDQFKVRVLEHNGGTIYNRIMEKVEVDPNTPFYDRDMPDWIPVSHFEYAHGKYNSSYYRDDEGYEFDIHEFC